MTRTVLAAATFTIAALAVAAPAALADAVLHCGLLLTQPGEPPMAEMSVHVDDDGRIRREFDLGDRFVCAYVGTIGMGCGLDVVLRAARQLRDEGRDDIRFLLVGDGAVRGELEQMARSRPDDIMQRETKPVGMA